MIKNKSRRQLFSAGSFFTADLRKKLIDTKRIWYWVAFFAATVVILVIGSLSTSKSYEVGDIAPESLIYEGATFSYISDVAYDKAVAEIEAAVNDVYTLDNTKLNNLNEQIDDFVDKMTAIKKEPDSGSETVVSIYKGLFGDSDTAAVYEVSLNNLSLSEIN
ncbi:MAG: hypothetical protein ACI4QO_02970, partial [Clostridia bacterium]